MDETKAKCLEETGKLLYENNQDIVNYLCSLNEEKNTLDHIIQRQYQERRRIEAEIEKLTYKLCLINKSLAMRIKSKNNYDKTIEEIKSHYQRLVISSTTLRKRVANRQQELDDIMNKKIGTGTEPSGEEIKMLYIKSGEKGPDDCPCEYMVEPPTKDNPVEQGAPFQDPPEQGGGAPYQDDPNVDQPLPEKDPGQSRDNSLKDSLNASSKNSSHNSDMNKSIRSADKPTISDDPLNTSSTNRAMNDQSNDIDTHIYDKTSSDLELATETEVASITPNKECNSSREASRRNRIDEMETHYSFDKPGGALPLIPQDDKGDVSTSLMLARIRQGLNRSSEVEASREHSKLKTRQGSHESQRSSGTQNSSLDMSKNSSYLAERIDKKDVSDVTNPKGRFK